jgi:hypothetical protein
MVGPTIGAAQAECSNVGIWHCPFAQFGRKSTNGPNEPTSTQGPIVGGNVLAA